MQKIVLTLILLTFSAAAGSWLYAQDSVPEPHRKFYIPAYAVTQYAGNIGMVSAGPGWTFFKNRAEAELTMGYVPKFDASLPIYIMAGKVMYTPRVQFKIKKLVILPVAAGLACSYTFGERFSRYRDDAKYPSGYYWWNTVYRFGALYRAEARLPLSAKPVKGVGLYFETSSWDLEIINYSSNGNYNRLSVLDLFTFGIGAKIFF